MDKAERIILEEISSQEAVYEKKVVHVFNEGCNNLEGPEVMGLLT